MSKIPTRAQLILDAFGQGRWASLGDRLGAQFFDVLIFYFPLAGLLGHVFDKITFLPDGSMALTCVVLIAVPALVAAYQALHIDAANRLTPGRAIAGIALVDASSGRGIEFGRAYWRCVLSVLGSLLIVPNLLVAFTRRRQSAADLLVHTVVVQYRQTPIQVPGQPGPNRIEVARAAFDEDELAGCWRRLGARAFDVFLFCLTGGLALNLMLLSVRVHARGPMPALFVFVIIIVGLAMWLGCQALFTGSRLLATPGRDAAQIAVVDASTGKPIGFRRAYLRAVCSLIGAVLVYPSLMAAFDARKQSWSDRVAHTVVVRHAQRYRGMEKLTESLIVILIIAIIASIALPAMRDFSRREKNAQQLATIESDLAHYARLLQTRPRQDGAATLRLDSLGYVPMSPSTRYALSSAGVLYAEFTLDELSSAGALDPGSVEEHRSFLSLSPEYDAATGQTAWHCRYLGFWKVTPPRDCEESPSADPSSAGLPE